MRRLCCRSPGAMSCRLFSSVRPLWWIIGRNGAIILVYYLLSIGLTFYQNNLLKKIKFPLSIVLCHLVIKFLLASFIRLGYELYTRKFRILLDCDVWFKKLSLIGVSGGLDIGLSNWSQEFVTVSLYTMTKSSAIVFILFFALLLKLEEKHWSLVFIVTLISGGLVMFTYKSTQFHLLGFSLVLGASVVSGLRWSMAQLVTQKASLGLQNPIDLIYHVQPFMIMAVFPFACFFEGFELTQQSIGFNTPEAKQALMFTVTAIVIGALVAFFMECAEFLLVSFTSSLTLAVVGIFKEICTLGLAVIINHDQITVINFMGLLMCLTGILCHVSFKFAKSAKDLGHVKSVSIGMEEVNLRTDDDNLPLLTKPGINGESEEEDSHTIWSR